MKNQPINDDLLVKYLLNEADSEERSLVNAWLHENHEHAKQLEHVRIILENSRLQTDDTLDAHAALARLNQRLEQRAGQRTVNRQHTFRRTLRIAAALLLLCGGAWLAYSLFSTAEVRISTTAQIQRDTLPDGSFATLNKYSALSYPKRFTGGTRKVELQGEAFFNVSPDKSKPFIITVNDVRIRVVGTAFNVRSRQGETTVTVASGEVEVSRSKHAVSLRAGEKTSVTASKPAFNKVKTVSTLYDYYVNGRIVCDQTPLGELVPVLNEKFGSEIILGRPGLEKLRISTTFHDESLTEVLSIISETFNLLIEHRGEQIILR
ncbi:FecR domain-containing protein [Pedobacter yulinensis]|nr:FecR domain-containing protein [Pedobacter yulinensis]